MKTYESDADAALPTAGTVCFIFRAGPDCFLLFSAAPDNRSDRGNDDHFVDRFDAVLTILMMWRVPYESSRCEKPEGTWLFLKKNVRN